MTHYKQRTFTARHLRSMYKMLASICTELGKYFWKKYDKL